MPSSRETAGIGRVAPRSRAGLLALCLAILPAGGAVPAEASPAVPESEPRAPTIAIVGATIHVGDGTVIEDGAVVVAGTRIAAVAKRAEASIPEGARVIEAAGLHLVPGLVDLDARLLADRADAGPVASPAAWSAADALEPFDPDPAIARLEGVTTVALGGDVQPGACVLGSVAKLRAAGPVAIVRDAWVAVSLVRAGAPTSSSAARLEDLQRLRLRLRGARDYRKAWDDYWKAVDAFNDALKKRTEAPKPSPGEAPAKPPPDASTPAPVPDEKKEPKPPGDFEEPPKEAPKEPPAQPAQPAEKPKPQPQPPPAPPKRPAVDLAAEAFLLALDGKVPVLIRADRRDEVLYALGLAKEFRLRAAILGATEAGRVADRVREAGCAAIVRPVLLEERALERSRHSESTAARVAAAGAPVAISSAGDAGGSRRSLRLQAALAVRGGLPVEAALRAITLEPARILGLDGRLGSVAPGKDADLVLLDGPPLDARSRVASVLVDGDLVETGSLVDGPLAARTETAPAGAPAPVPPPTDPTAALAAVPEAAPLVLRGAMLVTSDGSGRVRRLAGASVVVRDGKVRGVRAAGEAVSAEGSVEVDLAGRWLLPGLIDPCSDLGMRGETDEPSRAVLEDLRALEGFDPWDDDIVRALGRGVTSVGLAPGPGNPVGGEIAVVKLVPGAIPPRTVRSPAALRISLAPNLDLPRFPTSIAGTLRLLESWARERPVAAPLPLVVEVPDRSTAERALGILAPRGGSPSLLEGRDADPVAWAAWSAPCPVIVRAPRLEDRGPRLRLPALLRARGAEVALTASGGGPDPVVAAALAVRNGLDEDSALRAITEVPAGILGVAGTIGALREGADADIVVWSGDPFSLNARIEAVLIDGRLVWPAPAAEPRAVEGRARP